MLASGFSLPGMRSV